MLGWGAAGELVRTLERSALALGAWGPVLFVAGFAALATAGVPRAALTVLGASTYGSLPGAGLAWMATMLAAAAGFGLGRVFGLRLTARVSGSTRFAQGLGGGGFWSVFMARVSPVPFWMISCAAGAVGLRWAPYAAGTAIGVLPGLVAYALAGPALGQLLQLTPALAVVPLGGLLFLQWRRRRRAPEHDLTVRIGTPAGSWPGCPGRVSEPGCVLHGEPPAQIRFGP